MMQPIRDWRRTATLAIAALAAIHGCACQIIGGDSEEVRTQRALGVALESYPTGQGEAGFDELPKDAPAFPYVGTERPLSGSPPASWLEGRRTVAAVAPDGIQYEAYVGYPDPGVIAPGHGFVSSLENRRQDYGTHHGYVFLPEDVFIGTRQGRLLHPKLFFRDVGSHSESPHYIAFDSKGACHLVVADVNIYQGNRLDLYWAIGNPTSRTWTAAYLIERRGFTSWSLPWIGSAGETVHLVWSWYDATGDANSAQSGLFHLARGTGGFTRKVRVAKGDVAAWDAGIDQETGELFVAFSSGAGVEALSRPASGSWTTATRIRDREVAALTVEPRETSAWVVKVDDGEIVLTPKGDGPRIAH